jgi:hypothetical protein
VIIINSFVNKEIAVIGGPYVLCWNFAKFSLQTSEEFIDENITNSSW